MNSENGSFLSVEDPSDEDSRLVVSDLDVNQSPWIWEPRVGKDVNVWGHIRKGEFSIKQYWGAIDLK